MTGTKKPQSFLNNCWQSWMSDIKRLHLYPPNFRKIWIRGMKPQRNCRKSYMQNWTGDMTIRSRYLKRHRKSRRKMHFGWIRKTCG